MQFAKGHGTGNDFVLLPDPDNQLPLTPALVAAICDRRRGIGADGVLRVVRAAKHPEGVDQAGSAEWFMDYWNADGSLSEMCGNGIRVFVRYLISAGLAGPDPAGIALATRSGVVRVLVNDRGFAVELRRPRITGSSTATVGGLTLTGTAVDCGNPHLVCVLPASLTLTELDLTRAPAVESTVFVNGVNVEFITPGEPVSGADLHLVMRVHERGSGETFSCGSGACAAALVALRDVGRTTGVVVIDVPGGRLTISVDDERCQLAGPAVLVARGELDPATIG